MRRCLVLLVIACGGPVPAVDSGVLDSGASDAGSSCRTSDGQVAALGLNDVSLLVPLDAGSLVAPAALLPRALHDRLVLDEQGMPFVIDTFDKLYVVAVRFDLCDRTAKGECPAGSDGVLRLVLQPNEQGQARDTAFHAFFRIPARELPQVLDVLKSLSSSTSAALAVRTLDAEQRTRVKAMLERWCSPATLIRVTFFTQPDFFAQVRWVFRGVERASLDAGFGDVVNPGISDGGLQHVFLGSGGFEATPLADVPPGFRVAIDGQRFQSAAMPAQLEALAALAEVEDPGARNVDTLQCVTCHVTTPLRGERPVLPPRFISSYDLSTSGGASVSSLRSLRAFGWFGTQPMISQRVVNESAQVLTELLACP